MTTFANFLILNNWKLMSEPDFKALDPDEVLGISDEFKLSRVNLTCTVQEFLVAFQQTFKSSLGGHHYALLEEQGMPCRAWRFGQRSWQSGHIRFTLEFCPDESDEESLEMPHQPRSDEPSPLDSIRQLSNPQE
ncbi:MAG: hypothetical protein MH825_01660 [Cyanobacteria bacterium]|nr:hypothetical protein [Cyanobacteriota bacterium]